MLGRVGPEEPRVALLVHEEVRVVDLLKLKLDGLDECLRDDPRRFLSKSHRLCEICGAKLDHHRVSVAVDDLRVVLVAILTRVVRLHLVLCRLDHLPAESRDRR